MMGGEVFLFFGKFLERGLFFLGAIRATHPALSSGPISPAGGPIALPAWRLLHLIQRARQEEAAKEKNLEKPPAGHMGHMGHFRAHDKLQCAHLEPIAAQRLRGFVGHMGTYL